MKFSLSLLLVLFFSVISYSQQHSLKELALEEFKNEQYDNAILLLEKALEENDDDAEIYYYLGWFNHYRAYDSRPLLGYDYSYSSKIFNYLDKAIELNSNYGDAKYFYGAECSANAFLAMQNKDAQSLKYYYNLAYNKGAYPQWLIEYGKNILNTCDDNSILFLAGNADFDVCSYLQLVENFRTDISIVPIGFIDRPWYVNFIKNGLGDSVKKIDINILEQQIMDIRPFKWRESNINIDISNEDKIKFGLANDYQFVWNVSPDLNSERIHSKMNGEEPIKRTYLSPQRAILLQIVEDNFDKRPIYFSNFAEPSFYGGLNDYFQNCGLISRLVPLKTEGTIFNLDNKKYNQLINSKSLSDYNTIIQNDIPRISKIVMFGYGKSFLDLANHYKVTNENREIAKLLKIYNAKIKVGFNNNYESFVAEELNNYR